MFSFIKNIIDFSKRKIMRNMKSNIDKINFGKVICIGGIDHNFFLNIKKYSKACSFLDMHTLVFLISAKLLNEHGDKTNSKLLIDVASDNNIEDKTLFLLSHNVAFNKFSFMDEKESKYVFVAICSSTMVINYKLIFASKTYNHIVYMISK